MRRKGGPITAESKINCFICLGPSSLCNITVKKRKKERKKRENWRCVKKKRKKKICPKSTEERQSDKFGYIKR